MARTAHLWMSSKVPLELAAGSGKAMLRAAVAAGAADDSRNSKPKQRVEQVRGTAGRKENGADHVHALPIQSRRACCLRSCFSASASCPLRFQVQVMDRSRGISIA